MTNKNNSELRMELRKTLLSILKVYYKLASLGTTDNDTAYTDVAYETLYVFDSLIIGSTLEYNTEKHDAILNIADCIYRYLKD